MALVDGTAGLSFRSVLAVALLLAPLSASAQVSARDREAIVRLAQSRGADEGDVAPLLDEVTRASERGLPQPTLLNKVKEGLSKGHPPARVQAVLKDLVGQLDAARGMLGNAGDEAMRTRAMVMLAEALGRGVTRPEFEELRRLAQEGAPPPQSEGLAIGARFWALLKEAGFSTAALPLVAETVRQDYRAADVATLAREMAARRDDLASGTRLDALRQAVRRGERPERLLPPRDAGAVERPRVEPQRTPDRPERQRPAR
jgi:hypothetical protein